jgi:hypothetical protein
MDLLVAALAGGAAGAAIAALARVPSQVRSHNRLVGEYDDELGNWVADESVRLERELKRATRRFAEADRTGEEAHARALAHVKEESLRAWRDSELAAKHRRAELRDTEGWQHDLWRWVTVRGQLPPLRTPRKVKPILDTWREPASVTLPRPSTTRPVATSTRSWAKILSARSARDSQSTFVASSPDSRSRERSDGSDRRTTRHCAPT